MKANPQRTIYIPTPKPMAIFPQVFTMVIVLPYPFLLPLRDNRLRAFLFAGWLLFEFSLTFL